MTRIAAITKVYSRRYTNNNTTTVYIEWVDTQGKPGRTEGQEIRQHMQALLRRAQREGIFIERRNW